MNQADKVLIIKLGWSETLDAEISRTSSLGDTLRTTVVLHELQYRHVTWLVDEKAFPLIENNPFIHRPLIYDLTSVLQLQQERFDTVINFEKVPGLCALADNIKARRHMGFGFNSVRGEAVSNDGCERVFSLCRDRDEKRVHRIPWQKMLIEMVGGTWNNQEYILGYKPQAKETFDFGFNHAVGKKWPTKNWPQNKWEHLERLLTSKGFTVSWQKGFDDLREYMEWIQSCRALVTCDSLGFHLALALRKKTLVMYGPTNSNETYMYGRGIGLQPTDFACAPCLSPNCTNEVFCMDVLSPEKVYAECLRLLEL